MKTGNYRISDVVDRSCTLTVIERVRSDGQCVAQIPPTTGAKKIPYPRSVISLLGSVFFERAATNGMKTVLIIYFTTQLSYDTDHATMIYHSYMTLCFFTAIFGAIVSDSWLGKYNTILSMYALGLVGMLLLNLSTIHPLHLPERELTIAALVILALGMGCMKPCMLAFGGDQFCVPEQLHLMSAYFSMVFFVLKVAAFVGTALTPMLRTSVNCFGQESCFLLAFSVSAGILLASMLCFVMGKCLYVVRPSSGNIILQVFNCIGSALIYRFKANKSKRFYTSETPNVAAPSLVHWLDYAEPRHGKQLVHDTKILLNVLILYVPIPFYWALNEQTGSRWTLQATRMVGNVFGDVYTIKPDQMQIVMQVLLIAFIPLFETLLYPAIARVGIRRPLQKIALAMALAGTAFVVAGYVETRVAVDYAVMPTPDVCQLRVYNTWPHAVQVVRPAFGERAVINGLDAMQSIVPLVAFNSSDDADAAEAVRRFELHVHVNTSTPAFVLPLVAGGAVSYYFDGHSVSSFADSSRKATSQRPRLRILVVRRADVNASNSDLPLTLYDQIGRYVRYRRSSSNHNQFELAATRYTLHIGDELVTDRLQLSAGSVSTLLVRQRPEESGYDVNVVQLTAPNSVHMLWMLPQYALLAAGEAIMGVTGMFFAYSEAPESMKTVLQACWLLTIALGHMIDVIVVGANFINSQTAEFFTFAGLMIGNIILFTWLVSRYRPLPVGLLPVISTSPDGKVETEDKSAASTLAKTHRV